MMSRERNRLSRLRAITMIKNAKLLAVATLFSLLMAQSVAAEAENGARLVLAAGVADEIVVEMRYRVWGCPHLIAAAETLCKEREQAAVAGLSVFALAELMEILAIPVEKTGRILLLEDALNSLWGQYSGAD